jgi:hypothetical protein
MTCRQIDISKQTWLLAKNEIQNSNKETYNPNWSRFKVYNPDLHLITWNFIFTRIDTIKLRHMQEANTYNGKAIYFKS